MVLISGAGGGVGGAGGATVSHAAIVSAAPATASLLQCDNAFRVPAAMWIIILEALLALGLLIFIIWWTMFHGRRKPPSDSGE